MMRDEAMKQKTFLLVFGTRPEAIKMAPVLHALRNEPEAKCVVCVTGQHEELLNSVLSLFRIEPDYNLRVMSYNQQLCHLTARLLAQLGDVIAQEKPDWVLVQGDTASATAGAMAGRYSKVPVAHIEAGLRSHNKYEPFPEEVNRRVIDVISDLHFVPTLGDKENLLLEGLSPESIYITGNTCIDALRYVAVQPFVVKESVLRDVPFEDKRIILVTVHRRENHGPALESICEAIRIVARRYRNTAHFVLPVHPNPNVTAAVWRHLDGIRNITLTAPLGYREIIALAQSCYFAMVDSGGLQEELPCLGKPALVLRNVSDRPAATAAGAAKIVGTAADSIVAAFTDLMDDPVTYHQMAQHRNLFGDGQASKRIARILTDEPSVVLLDPAVAETVMRAA